MGFLTKSLGAGLALGLAVGTSAQTLPRRVDCGDLNGHAAGQPGYELLTETSAPPGVSLSPAPLDTVHVAGNFPDYFGTLPLRSDVITVDPDRLDETHLFTSLKLADFTVLTLSGLPANTHHRVRLELGALAPWGDIISEPCVPLPPADCWDYFPTVSKQVRVDVLDPGSTWQTVASDVRCASSHKADTYDTTLGLYGGVIPVWVLAETDGAGELKIRLSTDGPDPLFLTGFELHAYEALPVIYQRLGAGPLQGSSPGLAAFVSAFNAGDFDLAETEAQALADPFERGVALAHLVGWLDGGHDGNFHLMDETRAALQASLGSHPAAAWLLDELDTLQRAYDHVRLTGYSNTFRCPDEGGRGFVNKACGGQIALENSFGLDVVNANAMIALRELRGITAPVSGSTVLDDLVDWNAGTLSPDWWEPSPYVFAALKLAGVTMVQVNPNLSMPGGAGAAELDQDKRDIFDDFIGLGFAATDFPADLELRLFHEYLNHGGNGAAPKDWDIADIESFFTDEEIDGSWWGADVAPLPDDPSAPAWARLQRNQMNIHRAINRYWLRQRLDDHEVGGGWGDDVELLAAHFGMVAGTWSQQLDRRELDAVESMVRYGIEDHGAVADGYHVGPTTDVQHSAEYTTNPFIALRAAYGHTAMAGEIGLGVTEHLLDSAHPSFAFAAPTVLGRTHFRSYFFDSQAGVSGDVPAVDILLNGRAMYPGISAAMHWPLDESHPLVADLTQWAEAWAADAAATTGGKPVGFYGPVQWDSNILGLGGFWWSGNGSSQDVSAFSDISYILELKRMAYHRSSASDRWRLLEPAARMFRAVQVWEDAGSPAGNPGSAHWAASKLKSSVRFGSAVVAHYADLENDPDLTTLIPAGASTPYVDETLLTRMRMWVEAEYNGQGNSVRYALGEIGDCTGGAKNPLSLLPPYEKAISYYRLAYPLLTLHTFHTDRVFLNYQGSGAMNLLSAATATHFVEGLAHRPLVRWQSHLDDGLDIAIQTNFKSYDGTGYSAFVYNFDTVAADITLMLDEGLVPGEYLVEWGDAVANCDSLPPGAMVSAQTVQKRGRGASVAVSLAPGLNLVRAFRQGASDQPASGYDLALDPATIEVVGDGVTFDATIRARVANIGSAASPPATMNIYGSVLASSGAVVLMGGVERETLLASFSVPSLAGMTAWSPHEHQVSHVVPPTSPLWQDLPPDGGFQVRVEVSADGLDNDLLNDDLSRGWFFTQQLPDCDGNGLADVIDIVTGAADCNGNLALDACELGAPVTGPAQGLTSRQPLVELGTAGEAGPATGPAPDIGTRPGCLPSDVDTDGNCVIDACEP